MQQPVRMALAFLAAATVLLTEAAGGANARESASASADPLHARAVADLTSFTQWLTAGSRERKGLIGEVGWPGTAGTGGDARWNQLANDWYERARRSGLWVAAWAAGDFWAPSYKLLAYNWSPSRGGSPNSQAAVIERQRASELRGINLAGAEFATPVDERTSPFSNRNRGAYGRDYVYPSGELMEFLARRGITFVRLPIRWERLQPELGRPLDGEEAQRLRRCLVDAQKAGLKVILDLHNYGAYYLGSSDGVGVRKALGSRDVPSHLFADLWRRLSVLFAGNATVVGYGLMNEPVGMAGARAWEEASRAAVRAVRGNQDRKRIFVQSYFWGGARQFQQYHPRGPWIEDSNTWYEAHQYFDGDRSARYLASYEEETAAARRTRG